MLNQPRSRFTHSVYDCLRSYTEENGDCIRPPCTKTVNDQFSFRISPYVPVYDTEIYARNTITCKPSYFFVYGRLRPCLFDLGMNIDDETNFQIIQKGKETAFSSFTNSFKDKSS